MRAFDATLKPVTSAIDALEKDLTHLPTNVMDSANPLTRDFIAARLGYAAQRYDTESRQNQVIAQLLELQVRQSNTSAERQTTAPLLWQSILRFTRRESETALFPPPHRSD